MRHIANVEGELEMPTCFFIGHREAPDSLLPELFTEIERHITEYGVTDFVVGQYGRFDAMAAKCVKVAKKRHSEVTLTLLLPYHPYDRPTPTPPGSILRGWKLFQNTLPLFEPTAIWWIIAAI